MTGYCVDVLRHLGSLYNFSLVNDEQVDGLWGFMEQNETRPAKGVLGKVARGEYDLSLSTWVWNQKRDGIFDFVPTISLPVTLALTPQHPKVGVIHGVLGL